LSYPTLVKDYRKALVKGFPYLIVYEVLEDLGIVLIVSVFYTRRDMEDLKEQLI
jgi:plasmid stabilization system protein ParE